MQQLCYAIYVGYGIKRAIGNLFHIPSLFLKTYVGCVRVVMHSDFSCVISEREPRNCVTESFGRWPTIDIAALDLDRIKVIITDTTDFDIMKAIAALKVPYPKADKINSLVNLDPEELAARLGVLEMEGYIKTKPEADMVGDSLPNGISAAGLTNQGRRALSGPRW